MNKSFLLLIFLLFVPPQALTGQQSLELHVSNDIADIERLDQEVSQLIAKVRQCAAAGLAPASECFCMYPAKLEATREVYSSLLDKHPHWIDLSLHWRSEDRSLTSNLHLRGLRDRIEQPCT